MSADAYVDDWGVLWEHAGPVYYEVTGNPIRGLRSTTWTVTRGRTWRIRAATTALRARAKAIQDAGYAVVASAGCRPGNRRTCAAGIENVLYDLAGQPGLHPGPDAQDHGPDEGQRDRVLEEAGDLIDVLITGDDLGMQNAPMMSPRMYRRMIKPFHAEIYGEIKKRTKAKVFYHSDGNIYPLLGDLVEVGVDLLNPVQVNAGDMGDTARLKREFGKRLSFCGAIDTGRVLPYGTAEDVRAEVGGALGTWGRAEAISWRRSTASSRTSRPRTLLRCWTRRNAQGVTPWRCRGYETRRRIPWHLSKLLLRILAIPITA